MYRLSVRKMLVVLLCAGVLGGWTSGGLRAQTPGDGTNAGQSPTVPTAALANSDQSPANPGESLAVAAQSEVRSQMFHLQAGTQFEVTGNSEDPRFSVDLYVYNTAKELVGKDNPDSTESAFRWHPSAEGDYYILARNLSEGSGTIHIAVTAVRKTRGLGGPAPAVSANYATISVFYATDRATTGSDARGPTYGGDPDASDQLSYGEVAISIPRDHRMGELEGPSILRLEFHEDPDKHVVLQRVVAEDRATFVKGVSARLSHSRNKEVLVFVHGFNTSFEDAARRTAQIAYDMAFDGPTVLYSWPSQGSMSPFAYNKDGRNAALTVPHLEEFLKMIAARTGATTIDLIAHSMGNRPVTAALRDLAIENPGLKDKPMFNQVALMAPDVDAALFRQMAQQMEITSRRITLYASSRDAALKLSEVFAGYQRAGEGAPNLLVVPGMDTVDASAVDTNMLGFYHSYFADSTTVLSDLFHDFTGTPAASRLGLHAVITAAGKYWKFEPSS